MRVNHLWKTKHDNEPFAELLIMIAMRSMIQKIEKEGKDSGEEDNISSID